MTEFNDAMLQKFIDISERQATALASLAEIQRRGDSELKQMGESQERIANIVERVSERLDRMDDDSKLRTERAVGELKGHVSGAVSDAMTAWRLSSAVDARWLKIMVAVLGFLSALVASGIAALALRRANGG